MIIAILSKLTLAWDDVQTVLVWSDVFLIFFQKVPRFYPYCWHRWQWSILFFKTDLAIPHDSADHVRRLISLALCSDNCTNIIAGLRTVLSIQMRVLYKMYIRDINGLLLRLYAFSACRTLSVIISLSLNLSVSTCQPTRACRLPAMVIVYYSRTIGDSGR